MEGLERCRTKFTLDLHPSKLASAAQGVRAHLSSLLLRYNDDLEGVMLSYSNARLLTRQASIHPYFAFVRVEVAVDGVLFHPKAGMRLVGMVNKVGADYIGVLLLGFINVSIAADQIRAEFRPRPMERCWVSSKAPRHRLEVGTKLHFTVAAVQHSGQFVSLAGSLLQPGTGADGFAAPPAAAAGAAQQQQRRRKDQRRQSGQQPGQQQQQQQQQDAPGKKQKKRKKCNAAERGEQQPQQAQSAAPPPPAQQQQQQQQGVQAAGKKGKKSKPKQAGDAQAQAQPAQQRNGGEAAGAAAASGKKEKQKKRKAEGEAAAPAAQGVAAVGDGVNQQEKKKKRKDKH